MTITNTTKCNGWTNYETWLCNLWMDSLDFQDSTDDGTFDDMNFDEVLTYVVEYIRELVDTLVEDSLPVGNHHGFIHDMLNSAIQEVNYGEIARQYAEHICEDERFEHQRSSENEIEMYPIDKDALAFA